MIMILTIIMMMTYTSGEVHRLLRTPPFLAQSSSYGDAVVTGRSISWLDQQFLSYKYICIYTYIYKHVYVHIYVHVYMYIHTCIHISINIFKYVSVCIRSISWPDQQFLSYIYVCTYNMYIRYMRIFVTSYLYFDTCIFVFWA
jgi:hypothetical protein